MGNQPIEGFDGRPAVDWTKDGDRAKLSAAERRAANDQAAEGISDGDRQAKSGGKKRCS
jgi:hypothetical protein